MKAAVAQLEPHMDRTQSAARGKVLLATVKGDVHDIGKNLVDIILSNNGYTVVNLGIKVPSEQLIQGVREHQPDVIGLSGLLVKSAQQMVLTAGDLAAVGIDTPLLVGGAALTRRFTHRKIAGAYSGLCTYAKDAMNGLALVERITSDAKRPALIEEVAALVEADKVVAEPPRATVSKAGTQPSSKVRRELSVPPPPDLDRHVEELDPREVWSYLNPQMLYGKHLGLGGSIRALTERQDPKLVKLEAMVTALQAELLEEEAMPVRAVWRFFPARAEGNRLSLYEPSANGSGPVAAWELPRQAKADGLCLVDYLLADDHLALFVTTAGRDLRGQVERLKEAGEYLKSHTLAALALETAEAAAELVHARLRTLWGFPDPPDLPRQRLFGGHYHGKRFSFGYPACPDLAGQRQLFTVLQPGEIGVELTEGDMMDPEASVSALVFHHPDARYFGV